MPTQVLLMLYSNALKQRLLAKSQLAVQTQKKAFHILTDLFCQRKIYQVHYKDSKILFT